MTTATKQARTLNTCWQPVYGEWCALILHPYSTRICYGRGFSRRKFTAIRKAILNARQS